MQKYTEDGLLLRDLRKSGHYTLDNDFLDSGLAAIIRPAAAMVYNVLCRFANIKTVQAFPSYETISRLAGVSVMQAKRSIKILEKYKIISVERRTGRGHSNIYSLLSSSEWLVPNSNTMLPIKNVTSCYHSLRKNHNVTQKSNIMLPIDEIKGNIDDHIKGNMMLPEQTNIEQKGGGGGSCVFPVRKIVDLGIEKQPSRNNYPDSIKCTAKTTTTTLKNFSFPDGKKQERIRKLQHQQQQLLQKENDQ
jgi:hypothetical protein